MSSSEQSEIVLRGGGLPCSATQHDQGKFEKTDCVSNDGGQCHRMLVMALGTSRFQTQECSIPAASVLRRIPCCTCTANDDLSEP